MGLDDSLGATEPESLKGHSRTLGQAKAIYSGRGISLK
jgi:hypothetical protein